MGIDVGRNQVVEIVLAEDVGKQVLHLDAVVVHGHHGIDTGLLQEFGIEEAREGLAIELLEVDIRTVLFEFADAVGASVLSAVEQVGFNKHHLLGTIVLRGAGQDAVAHGVVVTAAFMVRNRANQHDLTFQTAADMFHVVHVQHVARAEFGVGEGLQGDHVGDVFTDSDVLRHVDGERIIGKVSGHDKTI